MEQKKAYFFLGLNGAGKSTFRSLKDLSNITIIDPDKIKVDENCSDIEAGRKAISLFKDCIWNVHTFSYQ